jgi:hypothetical protein
MLIKTHKGYLEVRFRWNGKRLYFSMGCACKTHLDAAQKYTLQIKQVREQCRLTGQPLPAAPKPERIPCLGKIIQTYKVFSQSESLPTDLFFKIAERARELNLTAEQSLKYLEQYEDNYKKLVTEKRLKATQAKARRAATIAAKKASKASSAYAATKHLA